MLNMCWCSLQGRDTLCFIEGSLMSLSVVKADLEELVLFFKEIYD